jgi:ATP-dependent DNA helicase RecQ
VIKNIHQIVKEYWGFDNFRPLQQDIIQSVLDGNDTLALMPTGGGKSLCYQVPGLAKEGMCLVISPLIALMKDQVESLRRKNITAYSIYSGMTRKELIRTLKVVTESNCKFLFVSPERLETALFKEYLPGMGVNLIAVDEAHCISQWGYDFRPAYLRIAALREELPDVPVLALTASATEEVQKDICEKLGLATTGRQTATPGRSSETNWKVFRQSFERPNLSYSAFKVDSRINKIMEIIQKVPGSGIIYCKSRKRTKEISDLLRMQGVQADYYHAGLANDERNLRQEDWIKNRVRIIVCTNAFGMGIDKPDVRIVIHADVPDCLENYYQEAGRAGRDGKTSYAVLLYNNEDLDQLEEMLNQRFPTLEEIKIVYQAVVNYLQLPVGEAPGTYYDFDITDFLKKFKLNSNTGLYSLKALEQEGWLSFNEQVFLPATVQFTTNKDYLYSFEKKHPALEAVIKTLLRSYEGIFDHTIHVSEKIIAGLLRKEPEDIINQLSELHHAGILKYTRQKDTPQLLFMRSRVKSEEITINLVNYNRRKDQLLRRICDMIDYVNENNLCRSSVIGGYFGDKDVKPCGICDNCLRGKGIAMNKQEFETIHHRIVNIVKYESLHVRDLLLKMNGIKKEKAWKVLEFLQAEQMIEMDPDGQVRFK